jgi:predicted transcriptional regulator of viral defense system
MNIEKYKSIFDKYKGVIKLSEFTSEGYHNSVLNKLMEDGYVSKIKAGYYEWLYDEPISDAVVIMKLFPKSVVCLESALYIYGYTDRTPLMWHLAVNKNDSKSKFKIDYPPIKVYFLIEKYIKIGKSKVMYEDLSLQIFDRERTICDVIRYEKKLDKEIFNKAIKMYMLDSKKNIGTLMDYAKLMNIESKVASVIGMWI